MPKVQLSPFQKHKAAWISCTRCPLHTFRKNVVLVRGQLPCDVLFIGEGPGDSEDVLGKPFVGPAGRLLDKMIEKSLSGRTPPRIAFTNIVACIPKDDVESKRKEGEPNAKEIKACAPRVDDFINIAKPQLIICVGKHAAKQGEVNAWADRAEKGVVNIIHPSAILRADVSVKELWAQRCRIQLSDAFDEVCGPVMESPTNEQLYEEAGEFPPTKTDKVKYVKSQGQTRSHHCHWPGCGAQCPPAMWGCKKHWFMLPKNLRDRIWAAYVPGQEVNMTPSRKYLEVAHEVEQWILENT